MATRGSSNVAPARTRRRVGPMSGIIESPAQRRERPKGPKQGSMAQLRHTALRTILTWRSARDREADQRGGCALGRVEVAAGVDEVVELRLADRETRGNPADAPNLLLEVPDEFAPGAFAGEAAAVLQEDRD